MIYIYIYIYLVGGLEHLLFFYILGRIVPIDFHIFQRVETTNQYMICLWKLLISHMTHNTLEIFKSAFFRRSSQKRTAAEHLQNEMEQPIMKWDSAWLCAILPAKLALINQNSSLEWLPPRPSTASAVGKLAWDATAFRWWGCHAEVFWSNTWKWTMNNRHVLLNHGLHAEDWSEGDFNYIMHHHAGFVLSILSKCSVITSVCI